jgi:demethylmenaquinone methyltransferase/2-methoxy-6-polyprenyl-1,4-benzoquinol methylase
VRRLFARIADRYDLITVVLSYGQDRRWKRQLIKMAGLQRETRVLDLATGTGDLAFLAASKARHVVGLDITKRMLELAAVKQTTGVTPKFLQGDMMALPFRSATFDVVTTGYGIRNVPELASVLDEIERVLRPGGRFLSLDFDRPGNPLVRGVYFTYLTIVGSILGMLLHGDPDTYRYIPQSLRTYPGSGAVAQMLNARGFDGLSIVPVLGGCLAMHVADKRDIRKRDNGNR